jgi:hypothetical protein
MTKTTKFSKGVKKFPYSYYPKEQGQSGPGDYHKEHSAKKGFYMSKAKRTKKKRRSASPGPGHYNQKHMSSSKQVDF